MRFKIWLVAIALCLGVAGLRVFDPLPINAACLGNSGLLANGSFEADKSNWRFYTDGAARFRIDSTGFDCTKTALVQIDQPGQNTQLYQTKVRLEPATRYRLSFAAYSSNGNDLGVYLHEHSGDYTSYGLTIEQVDLSTAWQHFTFDFVTTGFSTSVADGRLRFWLSAHAAPGEGYWIDGIVLEQIGDNVPTATVTSSPAQPTPTATAVSSTSTATAPVPTVTAAEPTPTPPIPTPTATQPVGANPQVNPIVLENQQPGTTAWKLGRKANDSVGQVKGYASLTSVNKGESIDFHISVDKPQTYTIDIYRMGWYQGKGGRLMKSIGPLQGGRQSAPVYERDTGLIYCEWDVSYTLRIPEDWTSGIYLAKLTNANNYQNYIIFVVRDDYRRADLLYQQTVMTYQAYNNYPHDKRTGKSLYEGPSNGEPTLDGGKRAVMVSFDRPYSRDGSSKFFVWEYYFIRWIEQQGYDVAYSTNLDLHRNGERLLNYNAFVSSGHDEYWT